MGQPAIIVSVVAPADLVFGLSTTDAPVVVVLVAARLLVPLAIPRVPLLIVVALVIDAADQTLLAALTEVDTTETGPYQSVDKALDVYYLSIAYLSTMRNWTSDAAFRVAQFLFYYRLAGSMLFELTDARLMLLLFPNTFEFFFIAYELVRLRREPSRFTARFWLFTGAGLWVFVKLPQEYWIHIAKLDFTDAVRDYPAFGAAALLPLLVAAVVLVRVVYPRLPAPDWEWRLTADRLPTSLVEAHARYARRLQSGRVLTREAFEQVWLLGLICIIFASILPGVDATVPQIAAGVATIVFATAAISLAAARRGGFGPTSAAGRYAALLATNVVLIYLANALLGDRRTFEIELGLFFGFLVTTLIWLYDAFRPVYDQRFGGSSLRVESIGDLLRRVQERRP